MNRETALMNQIRVELSKTCVIFRANVGSVRMMDGRYFSTGLPKGFPDLFGFRKEDNRIVFVEVKTDTGKVRKEQKEFITRMKSIGCIAGVVRSVEEAVRLVSNDENVE